jgi:hypothetical protein
VKLTQHFSRVSAKKETTRYELVAKWDPGSEGFPIEEYPDGYSGSMEIESDSWKTLAKHATEIMEHPERHSDLMSKPSSIWVADTVKGNIYWSY